MDDLEKQFFANNSNDLSAEFFAEPVKEQTETNKRGANLAGAIRNIAQATPFIGTYADEAEALARMLAYNPRNYSYEQLRKNAEESALGNIENTGYGKALNIGANLAENAVVAGLTGGATLLPPVSAAQGAIEGFGKGDDLGSRLAWAGAGGSLGYIVPTALNRVLPTATVQKSIIENATKSKNTARQIIAKALQQGATPEEIIAKEVPKGMRPNLWANLRRNFTGKNALREPILEQASETVSKPYTEYIKEEVEAVAPKYAFKLGKEIEKMKLDQLGEDIVGEFDPRQYVMDAVNKVMRSASEEEKVLVAGAVEDAIAKRGVAKKLTTVAIERPISSSSGSFWNIGRRAIAPLQNIADLGLLRAMRVKTPNYVPETLAGRLFNRYTPNIVRGATDAAIENYELNTLK